MAELRKHRMRTAGLATTSLNITFKHMVHGPKYFPQLPHTMQSTF